MSDLISRSELLKAFNNKNVQITFDLPVEEVLGEDVDLDDFAMLVQDAIQAYKKMVIDTIKNQPTAYDIDKVVEEFDKKYNNSLWIKGDEEFSITRNELIEIAKQGGVSDDVCEWQSDYGFISDKYKRETSCGHTFYDLHHAVPFKYCPYCGKKIKVVE